MTSSDLERQFAVCH